MERQKGEEAAKSESPTNSEMPRLEMPISLPHPDSPHRYRQIAPDKPSNSQSNTNDPEIIPFMFIHVQSQAAFGYVLGQSTYTDHYGRSKTSPYLEFY